MRNAWYHLRRPTLVRRIIIAQMLLLTLLWSLFLTFILWAVRLTKRFLPWLSEWTSARRREPKSWKPSARRYAKAMAAVKIPHYRLTSSFARTVPLFFHLRAHLWG